PWAGEEAADFFDAESGRLHVAASRFVDQCLSAGSAQPGSVSP
ncbi:MAG: hypothetical protein QOH68_3915, partial [Nocardioidaceae bacterium]|nr:hypothetical protein [Nocardioidaceae bacterium]